MSQQKQVNPVEGLIRDKLEVCSIAALAEKIGVHKNTLYRFQRGGNLSFRSAQKLFGFFNLSLGGGGDGQDKGL